MRKSSFGCFSVYAADFCTRWDGDGWCKEVAGKLNRGLSVIDSYKLLNEGIYLTDDEIFLASALGWCIEWVQSYFLVLDDIMDGSHTRRGQPCWFIVDKVGMIAVNDGVLLRNHIPRILKNHFREKAYYVDLLELFNEVEFQTASGQMIDLITTLQGEKDLSKYTLQVWDGDGWCKEAAGKVLRVEEPFVPRYNKTICGNVCRTEGWY